MLRFDVRRLAIDCQVALVRDRLLQERDDVQAGQNQGGRFIECNGVGGELLPTPRLCGTSSKLGAGKKAGFRTWRGV